ncbi:LOW QUALITY PROTEIN: cyclic nucleotide-gated cation channel beta-3-like [Phyllopteryx taeniolatus]|uniref:LOW QUALITY PROTEIN: cyclic nucleotide-gated cation channel beta-3-like n=1 Tax=Phyllopteryx taeniolatus TaxID=161469 RepID=UPI002AD30901|nr:LOW QUALITY PROTEIN: cyclic nucleotide-gated cation channel beta-3-like [Phyllopteryx taeniolatus]
MTTDLVMTPKEGQRSEGIIRFPEKKKETTQRKEHAKQEEKRKEEPTKGENKKDEEKKEEETKKEQPKPGEGRFLPQLLQQLFEENPASPPPPPVVYFRYTDDTLSWLVMTMRERTETLKEKVIEANASSAPEISPPVTPILKEEEYHRLKEEEQIAKEESEKKKAEEAAKKVEEKKKKDEDKRLEAEKKAEEERMAEEARKKDKLLLDNIFSCLDTLFRPIGEKMDTVLGSIIDPFTDRRDIAWLAIVTVAYNYNLWFRSTRLAFPFHNDTANRYWIVFDILSDLVNVVDIMVWQPRLHFVEAGDIIKDRAMTREHYRKSPRFQLRVYNGTGTAYMLFIDACNEVCNDSDKSIVYFPGDFVVKKGDIGKEMCVIKSGAVQVVGGPDNSIVFVTLKAGFFFTNICLLQSAKAGGNRQTANVKTYGFANLFVLEKDLFDILVHYPESQKVLARKGRKLTKAKAPTGVKDVERPKGLTTFGPKPPTPKIMKAFANLHKLKKQPENQWE